ncbi:MAG: ATP-binding cassette domain-containing protein [Clostridia bacterium]|nr:ATP-binding cassette domain-containing protein [Clostridia bacterium]
MIELKDICYSFDNKVILDKVSLVFDEGINVITGPNGAGKSTLVKILMGIITPTSGSIFYNGQDITNMSITQRAKMGFSFAFQQPVKFKGFKVRDMLKIANQDKNVSLAAYLTSVGLCAKEYLNRELSGDLSGGELKRIEIASVLARNSKVTMFDEPEAGIDLWSFNGLVKTFKAFQENNKGIVIMISHQEKMIELADKLVLISDGKLEKVGTKDDVLPLLNNSVKSCRGCGV